MLEVIKKLESENIIADHTDFSWIAVKNAGIIEIDDILVVHNNKIIIMREGRKEYEIDLDENIILRNAKKKDVLNKLKAKWILTSLLCYLIFLMPNIYIGAIVIVTTLFLGDSINRDLKKLEFEF